MKKIIITLLIIEIAVFAGGFLKLLQFQNFSFKKLGGPSIIYPIQGGTGTSTVPTADQMLIGGNNSRYDVKTLTAGSNITIATSSSAITITSTSGASADWVKQTNYGVLNLTASTTIPYWAKDAIYASSTLIVQGNSTFSQATSTNLYSTTFGVNSEYFTDLTGSGLSNSSGVLTCSTASGSVFGCLASADWTTFNNKQATISATWPITLSGATVGFDGLSTSTAAVVGNIPYFSGVNTFANVATTSLTASSPLSLSQPISVIGGSASALSISTAGDWTGTIDSNNFAGGAIGAGELIYGGSAGSFSELALGTNGYVLGLSNGLPAWIATTSIPVAGDVTGTLSATVVGNDSHDHTSTTISGIDISADTNLTGGRSLTLTDDDILADAELYTGAITFAVASSSLATTTNLLAHKVSTAITITQVDGHCFNKGTTTIDIEQNGTTIFQTGQFWQGFFDEATGSATTSSSFADATVPAGSWLTYDIEGWNVGTPTNCITTIKWTKDD